MEQTKIREQVIDDLKQYPELKKKVILLRYEQEHPAKISDSEVIDSMALSRSRARDRHVRRLRYGQREQ